MRRKPSLRCFRRRRWRMAEDGCGNPSLGVSPLNARPVLRRHHRTTNSEVRPSRVGRILVGGSKGHLAHLLRSVHSNSNRRLCYRNNLHLREHLQGRGQGTQIPDPPFVIDPRYRKLTCYNCGEPGHFVGNCTRPKVCFICGIPGHQMNVCSK